MLLLPSLAVSSAFSIEGNGNPGSQAYSTNQSVTPFKHLEVALTGGTTGVGIDFATPVNDFLQLRGGFSFMPKFTLSMKFGVGIEENMYLRDEAGNTLHDDEGNPLLSDFGQIINYVEGFTGSKTQNEMTMMAEPSIHNFKLLIDVHPFRNKRWHFTGGVYIGSSTIASVINSREDMPTLYTANMFNKIYAKAEADEPYASFMGIDIYAGPALLDYGRIGLDVGQRADGSTYKMEPNEYCMVGVDAKVNTFKPYLGFGYGTSSLSSTRKTNISFDCGVLFWGGAPDLITHDGTNLTKDITNIEGKIGQYVDLARKFQVFPVINLRISRLLF